MPYLAKGWALGVTENLRNISMENFGTNLQHQYCSKIFGTSHMAPGVNVAKYYSGHGDPEIRRQQFIPKIKLISIEIEPKETKPKETKEARQIRLAALRERNANRKEERLAQQAKKKSEKELPKEDETKEDGNKGVKPNKLAVLREKRIKERQEKEVAAIAKDITPPKEEVKEGHETNGDSEESSSDNQKQKVVKEPKKTLLSIAEVEKMIGVPLKMPIPQYTPAPPNTIIYIGDSEKPVKKNRPTISKEKRFEKQKEREDRNDGSKE
jgi:hypothetical protein